MRKISLSIFIMMLIIISCNSDKNTNQKFLTVENIDSSIKPTDDFYMFVNGKWFNNTVIAPTESSAGAFLDIYNRTKDNLKTIFEDLSKSSNKTGTVEQQVADFYASGMDTVTIDKLGYEPLKPYFAKIDAVKNVPSLMSLVAEQQTEYLTSFIGLWIGADEKNSTMNLPTFYQTGLGLPDRDYYFKTDPATLDVIKAYKTYLNKLFTLTGSDSNTANKNVELVYELEKQMAASHLTNIELRNPQVNYNKMAVAAMDKAMPNMGWASTLKTMKIKTDSVNLSQPKYYQAVNGLLTTTPITTWQLYLKTRLLTQTASDLSNDFVNASFDYNGKALSGKKQLKPRWERVVETTDNTLSEALGQLYVKKFFTADAKSRMMELINNLQKAFENRINNLDWMSAETKVKAKEKDSRSSVKT